MQPKFPVSYMNISNIYQQEQIEIKGVNSSVSLFDLEGRPEVDTTSENPQARVPSKLYQHSKSIQAIISEI